MLFPFNHSVIDLFVGESSISALVLSWWSLRDTDTSTSSTSSTSTLPHIIDHLDPTQPSCWCCWSYR